MQLLVGLAKLNNHEIFPNLVVLEESVIMIIVARNRGKHSTMRCTYDGLRSLDKRVTGWQDSAQAGGAHVLFGQVYIEFGMFDTGQV